MYSALYFMQNTRIAPRFMRNTGKFGYFRFFSMFFAEMLDNIYIYNWMYGRRRKNALHRTFLLYAGGINMRFTIDTELERIIVPDTFFNQIDKMNAVLEANEAGDKKIDYVKYINDAIAKAQKNAPVRKADLKTLKK